jgi:tetratricopeptide (TPR) repeat protein
MRPARRDTLLALALALATFAVFSRALDCGFVNIDDGTYVESNPDVLNGLSPGAAARAWTTFRASNWHPLTWLSLQVDATLFGRGPRGFHRTNLLLHSANAAMLFLALRSLTGCAIRSALVAALFALHPLRVESVAWVSERKDVLSAFFGLLSLWAYARYARVPGPRRYLLVALTLGLSLLAKPMLVTFPFLLPVLDWWPLRRVQSKGQWPRILAEKLPLLLLCLASCVVTFIAQKSGGSVAGLTQLSLGARLQNAIVAYASYLGLAAWPWRLTVYYDLPLEGWPPGIVAISALLLLALSALAVWQRRRRPYLLAGWLWYLGTLVPVIGLVQVGDQSHADRYTYFPLIGPAVSLVWAVAEAVDTGRRRVALAAAGVALAGLAALTWAQIGHWQDSLALWDRNYDVSGPSEKCLNNRGNIYLRLGRTAEAAADFGKAVRLNPGSAVARANLGAALLQAHRPADAGEELDVALRLDPQFFMIPSNRSKLGHTLWLLGRDEEAMRYLREAAELGPAEPTARYHLGVALVDLRRYDEAAGEFAAAVRLDGRNLVYRLALAAALDRAGRDTNALVQQVAAQDPRWAEHVARQARELAETSGLVPREAIHAAEVVRLACKYSGARNPGLYEVLAVTLARARLFDEAVAAGERGVAAAEAARQPEVARAIAGRLATYRDSRDRAAAASKE